MLPPICPHEYRRQGMWMRVLPLTGRRVTVESDDGHGLRALSRGRRWDLSGLVEVRCERSVAARRSFAISVSRVGRCHVAATAVICCTNRICVGVADRRAQQSSTRARLSIGHGIYLLRASTVSERPPTIRALIVSIDECRERRRLRNRHDRLEHQWRSVGAVAICIPTTACPRISMDDSSPTSSVDH
jgi:hypothetical protein